MKTTSSLCRSLVGYALTTSILGLISVGMLAGNGRPSQNRGQLTDGRREAKQDAKEAAKTVDAIANHNKPPKIVRRRRASPSAVPLFPKDYNWKEEERVQKALNKISSAKSIELWEALVQKTNDQQYCITAYSWSSDDAYIYSVGAICSMIAYYRLCNVFEKHLPSVPPHGCPFQLESIQEDLLSWRKARKEKALYQLQIEVCEMAIRELRKVDAEILSDKGKVQARKKIEAEISDLKRSKKPFIGKTGIPRAYPQSAAKRVREAFEAGSLEDLDFRLNK